MADLSTFIETANRVAVSRQITTSDARILQEHAAWTQKFKDDRVRASASRSSFGAKRKPDNEVTPDALRKREARDKARRQT